MRSTGNISGSTARVMEVNLFFTDDALEKNASSEKNPLSSNRCGFQGQEKDDEIKEPGNSVNYKDRMHNPRLGRFFAVDPFFALFPWNSTYTFSGDRLFDAVELEGVESKLILHEVHNNLWRGYKSKATKIVNWTDLGHPCNDYGPSRTRVLITRSYLDEHGEFKNSYTYYVPSCFNQIGAIAKDTDQMAEKYWKWKVLFETITKAGSSISNKPGLVRTISMTLQ